MLSDISSYREPPRLKNAQGKARTFGFELEFSGLTFERATQVLTEFTGAALERKSTVEVSSRHPDLGVVGLELDWTYLKNYARESNTPVEGLTWGKFLKDAASLVVPLEIVCPPVDFARLPEFDALTGALRRAGATGSDESIIAAYGVHINPEIPALTTEMLLRYLKAFCLLQWWLADVHHVELARRLSTYVDLYPEAYIKTVLATDPLTTDLITLLDDYVAHNPTRNRALDLYPLFAQFDEDAVAQRMQDARIKKRPTFHYRLPNCEINRADWTLADCWGPWCAVEALAFDDDGLSQLSHTFLDNSHFLIGVHKQHWKEFVGQWLQDRSLV